MLSIDPGMAFFTLVIFLVLLAVLGRYAWKPLIVGLKRREDAIRESIEAAAAAQAKVEQTRRQLEEKIAQVQQQAALQLQQAKADAARAADAIRQRAETETKALKDQAIHDIQVAQQQAMRELAVKAADLSVDIAQRMLARQINDTDREKLLDESLTQWMAVEKEVSDSNIDEIVRVYAVALTDAAAQVNRLPEVVADVQALDAVFAQVPRFVTLLRAATISTAEKLTVLERTFGESFDALTRQGLAAMARRDRLDFLPEFVRVFQLVQRERSRQLMVELTVAAPLTDRQRQGILGRAVAALGQPVELTEVVNPALLGGAQWRLGDRLVDGSLRGKLDALRRQLRQNAFKGNI